MVIELVSNSYQHVANVEMPTFSPRPDCVVWGQRFFFKTNTENCYVEGFAWCVPLVTA